MIPDPETLHVPELPEAFVVTAHPALPPVKTPLPPQANAPETAFPWATAIGLGMIETGFSTVTVTIVTCPAESATVTLSVPGSRKYPSHGAALAGLHAVPFPLLTPSITEGLPDLVCQYGDDPDADSNPNRLY
jgi:hypothetical protein